jgi:hypothetical protein
MIMAMMPQMNRLSDGEAQTIRTALLESKKMFKPYFIDLTDEEKKGRTMAEGREGLVRLVAKIALAHEESLARNDSAGELAQRLDYDSSLEELRQELLTLLEMVTETQMTNGILAMRMNDRFIKNLQAGRDNNAGLDLALREVDEWNKRFANTGGGNGDGNIPPTAGPDA